MRQPFHQDMRFVLMSSLNLWFWSSEGLMVQRTSYAELITKRNKCLEVNLFEHRTHNAASCRLLGRLWFGALLDVLSVSKSGPLSELGGKLCMRHEMHNLWTAHKGITCTMSCWARLWVRSSKSPKICIFKYNFMVVLDALGDLRARVQYLPAC